MARSDLHSRAGARASTDTPAHARSATLRLSMAPLLLPGGPIPRFPPDDHQHAGFSRAIEAQSMQRSPVSARYPQAYPIIQSGDRKVETPRQRSEAARL